MLILFKNLLKGVRINNNLRLKTILKFTMISAMLILNLANFVNAKITNETCSDCHTMHNSQNATWMRDQITRVTGSGEGQCLDCHSDQRAVLLRYDCLGCHAKDINGGSNIINGWPQIAHNASQDLAGGNYRYVSNPNPDSHGHNVHGFGNTQIAQDSVLFNNPPGYDSNYDPSSGKYQPGNMAGQVLCAGRDGCHGNRDQVSPILAMKMTHHADDSMLKFGSINESNQGGGTGGSDYIAAGRSYRFLYNIHGGEDTDWEATVSSTDHNEYKGATFASRDLAGGQTWSNVDTISEFCAECHGYFHASDEITNQTPPSGSPWLRHPTDAVLPNNGEYSVYTTFSAEAPVARVNIPDPASSTVTPGTNNAIVMCLSCHRAHASPYDDILRWDYSTMIAGGGGSGGCFTCHTQKNTNP